MKKNEMENWESRENGNVSEQDWSARGDDGQWTSTGAGNSTHAAAKPERKPFPWKWVALVLAAVVVVLSLKLLLTEVPSDPDPVPPQTTLPAESTGPSWVPTESQPQQTEPASTTVPTEPVVYVNPFTDISEDAVYYESVLWAVEHGIINGTSETTFSPDEPCMRGQMVTMLWRAAGKPEPVSTVSPFDDVPADSVFFKAVMWAYENGIAGGSGATHFGANELCNRAQVITFLHRAVGSPAPTIGQIPCTDVVPGTFYYDAVCWAYEKGISNGVSETEFGINVICTRSQIATLLYRAYNQG